jgi:putative transposase
VEHERKRAELLRQIARNKAAEFGDRGDAILELEHAVFFWNRDSQIRLDVIQDACWGTRPAWMTRPYSEDLRERALARFESGETIRSIGEALGISPSCVSKWRRRKQETGSLSPGQIGGHKPRMLSGASADWLRKRCRSGTFTTRGLTAELAARGIKTDRRAVWVFVRAEGLSFKKKRSAGRAG